MKSNLQLFASYGAAFAAVATLSGCMDGGSVLAEESNKFAICSLDQGQNCQVHAPDGTKVEKASVASTDDAVRVLGMVKDKSECEGFAAHSKSRSPKHIAQATINNVVVLPFGEVLPHGPSVITACATPPYKVSLTVAKAP
jgi:hypothetical protein